MDEGKTWLERRLFMIRVTVWNEFLHEQTIPEIQKVYPEGIHGCTFARNGCADLVEPCETGRVERGSGSL